MTESADTPALTRPPASPVDPGRRPWIPYVAPMASFLVLTTFEGWLPTTAPGEATVAYYPWAYAIKIVVVVLSLWWSRAAWRDLRPVPGAATTGASVAIGIAVALIWVGSDGYYPVFGTIGSRAAYNPATLTPASRVAFLAVRFFGLVLVVPLLEELFWRSFVVRWLIDPDHFETVPIGRVTWAAAAVTAGLFALEHPAEWLPALGTGFAWAWLLHWSKSVSACFISHAVANLGLGVYVLLTGDWKFW